MVVYFLGTMISLLHTNFSIVDEPTRGFSVTVLWQSIVLPLYPFRQLEVPSPLFPLTHSNLTFQIVCL